MLEGSTFSALVDDVIQRSNRKDRIADIVAYARTSMRECLVKAHFQASLIEEVVTVDAVPFLWKRPDQLQVLTAVQYPYFTRHGKPVFAREKRPGIAQHETGDRNYYYLSGNSYVFNNLAIGAIINVAYLAYFARMAYVEAVVDRLARYDVESGIWVYHADYATSAAQQLIAQDKVTNWLLFRWYDLILEGVLAKIYKSVDDPRSKTSYALYKQQQDDLLTAEKQVTLDLR